MKQNDKHERISDWMSLLEDTSVPMGEAAERTDALRARVKLRMGGERQTLPTRRRFSGKWLPLTAAIIALTVTAAFAADFVVNQRLPFVFNSEEALVEAQYENEVASSGSGSDEETTLSYGVTSDDPADPEALAELGQEEMARNFDIYDGETLVSDEEGTGSDPYTRKQVVSVVDEWEDETDYYQETRYTGTGLSQIVTQEPLLKDWDLSALDENYTMVEGCNFGFVRNALDGSFLYANLWGMYRTENGGTFVVSSMSDTETDYGNAYTSVGADGFSETYTTKDGTEVNIHGNSQRVYAVLVLTTEDYYEYFSISSQGVTQQEMEQIADDLNLATFVSSFTAAAEGN